MRIFIIIFVHILLWQNIEPLKAQQQKDKITMKELTKEERRVLIDKGTELPFTGKYNDNKANGVYTCKLCGAKLYLSADKFDSKCGWPSFDDEIEGAVKREVDADGVRTEIMCANCDAHLGHVFKGEGHTPKNIRHCVNSISMVFKPIKEVAIFAGGCFWGVEHLMQQQDGVSEVVSGYIGGEVENPTYEQISTKKTGHAEAVQITFDPTIVDFERVVKLFFEIHDSTQEGGQGPDIGPQYRSEIFYTSEGQKEVANRVIAELKGLGYDVKTQVTPATKFNVAEDYHQNYYEQKGTEPYCHSRKEIFK